MTIKINRDTYISGQPVKAGIQMDVDKDTAETLIDLGHAVDPNAPIKPVKPKELPFVRLT